LVVLEAERAAAARLAGEAFESWHSVIALNDARKYHVLLVEEDVFRFRTRQISSKTLLRSKSWHSVRDSLGDFRSVLITFEARALDFSQPDPLRTSGFHLSNAEPSCGHEAGEAALAAVSLWADLGAIASPCSAEEALTAIVDKLFSRGGGIQAFIAKWGSAPQYGTVETEYERACGIRSKYVVTRRWCTRFLRAVSHTIWLGPELVATLGDMGRLRAVADLVPIDGGFRLGLRPGASLDDLERTLALLLASKADCEK
jgi:hypothetical protein